LKSAENIPYLFVCHFQGSGTHCSMVLISIHKQLATFAICMLYLLVLSVYLLWLICYLFLSFIIYFFQSVPSQNGVWTFHKWKPFGTTFFVQEMMNKQNVKPAELQIRRCRGVMRNRLHLKHKIQVDSKKIKAEPSSLVTTARSSAASRIDNFLKSWQHSLERIIVEHTAVDL